MAFRRKSSRYEKPRPAVRVVRAPASILLLAFGALLFCGWALERHCSFRPQPMLVPASAKPALTYDYDPDAGEIPVPEVTH